MTVEDLVGSYTVSGRNQDESEHEYRGILDLSLDVNHRITAKWCINNEQKQFGSGFFKDNILVINFYYFGENNTKFKGVAVYRVLTPNLLDGFWSEKYGDPLYLGTERCFKRQIHTLLN
ncbi:hypothetical protein FNB79_01005 [Formosa sediminum]|uniref:Uncharacterized protein n=1 Tax=Formosa sediminum TaxID=2594004 RepID=A0A516GM82_9FLAO|nr:hypothetical protein [Formosa sediminum]QDO92617.1 hypothetical protein FNB79_01005 [Formosa sediminum]